MSNNSNWHGTTIVLIRKGKDVVVAGDGQVSLGNTVIKSTALGERNKKICPCFNSYGRDFNSGNNRCFK